MTTYTKLPTFACEPMMFLGAKFDDQHRPHNSSIFAISEEPFKYGLAILAETAVRLLMQA
jgi:hypothetical protein